MFVKGQIYEVPCVRNSQYGECVVLLPSHSDGGEDCLKPIIEHYHIDFRFEKREKFENNVDALYKSKSDPIYYERKLCLEEFSTLTNTWPFFLERIHERLGDHLLEDNICPHRGVKIDNACGTCPAHGLRWNLQTRRLYYKPPFFLRFPTGDEGVVGHGVCIIKITEKYQSPSDGVYLPLYDSNGLRYKNAGFKIEIGNDIFKPGDTITIVDHVCGKK